MRDSNGVTPTAPASGVVSPSVNVPRSSTSVGIDDSLSGLGSPVAGHRTASISRLRIAMLDPETTAAVRAAIIDSLVIFIRDHSPKHPGINSFAYCMKPPPAPFPSEATLALQAIGETRGDLTESIDLSRVNLSYASLQDLDFRNVRFDGALLCRTWFSHSRLDGATFRDANLRFSTFEGAEGLRSAQLSEAESILNVRLPNSLTENPYLVRLREVDPECSPHLPTSQRLCDFQ
ncbi:pentapeptide repeat-containing protein [Knoellia sp. CPCC 206453]|uniref:pentapeptide repeat-containing protein n=1 Tax=Knoellia pratensis TaxID=3404796 RepID=UPI00360867FC